MQVFKPPRYAPENWSDEGRGPSVFLAGSIDMGAAVDWQAAVTEALSDLKGDIYNPRRDDWDPTWEQDISNPAFKEQVEWELDHLDQADIIAFYFDPNGKAPITLLELGLQITSKKVVVYCPKAYWRSGNVQIICDRFDVTLYDGEPAEFFAAVRQMVIDAGSRIP